MSKRNAFLSLVIGTSIGAVLGNFVILYLFNSGEIPFGIMLARFALPALVYTIAVSVLLGTYTPLFSSGSFNVKDEEFFQRLKRIGSLPIKSIALVLSLQLFFLWIVVFMLGNLFGIDSNIRAYVYGACLASGMAIGTFFYILSDRLVSRTLLTHNIKIYPHNLREYRQGAKICIIPLAATILSTVFVFSITVLSLLKMGVDITATRNGGWTGIILVFVIFIIFIMILTATIKNNSTILFNSVISQFENLLSGKKDLTRRINIISVDELGTIAGMMNNFCENTASGIREIKTNQQGLFVSSKQLETNAQGMNTAIERISSTIAQAQGQSEAQMVSVDRTSLEIRKTANAIETLDNSIIVQSESMNLASVAVEEMLGNIVSIGNVTEKMAEHFKSVNTAANKGIVIQEESSQSVKRIVEQSEALQEANRAIATISAQTNLLAMNAAIEAAHAGEAGRGFSVVADEIRKLAETASEESKKISQELKQISITINGIVKGTESSAVAFGAVSERVSETENLVYEVNSAIKEQQQGAEQILQALKRMNDITAEVKTGSGAMQKGNKIMLDEISLLQKQAKDISSGMENISMEINTISIGAGEVSKLAVTTHKAIETIRGIVNDFEV